MSVLKCDLKDIWFFFFLIVHLQLGHGLHVSLCLHTWACLYIRICKCILLVYIFNQNSSFLLKIVFQSGLDMKKSDALWKLLNLFSNQLDPELFSRN